MQKWNFILQKYEPYSVPDEWVCPLFLNIQDMTLHINCALCGAEVEAGDTYTSKSVHNNAGLGYHVCENCYEYERKMDALHPEVNP